MQDSFLTFLSEILQIFLSYTGFANITSQYGTRLLVGLFSYSTFSFQFSIFN